MTNNCGAERDRTDSKFSYLDELHLGGIERKIQEGLFVSGAELAAALLKNGARPISELVLDYLCRYLKEEINIPCGRPARPEVERRREMLAVGVYRRNLAWLQNRKKRYGDLKGWPRIRGCDFWEGPPSEKAARMAACRYWYGADSWRTIVNLSSSRK